MGKNENSTHAVYTLIENSYGFQWGQILVERTASSNKKPKFQVLRVFAPNGEGVEIQFSARKMHVKKFKKEKGNGY